MGAQYQRGHNLEVVWAEFSTLSYAVLSQRNVTVWHAQELKTRPRFRPVNRSLSRASSTDILLALPIYIMLGNKHQRENTLAYFAKASFSQKCFYGMASCELMRHVLMAGVFANVTLKLGIHLHVRFSCAISQPVHLPWTIKLLHNDLLL